MLSKTLTNEEDILGQLQEESDMLVGEIQRVQGERDELSAKVLVLEQINFEMSRKQIEMSETQDQEQAQLQEQLNKMTYVADVREKYLAETLQVFNRCLKRYPKIQTSCKNDVQRVEEIAKGRQNLLENVIGKQQLHLKSVIFERDNLQMELEEAFQQIDKLEQQVEVAQKIGEQLHTQMEIRENPYEELEGVGVGHNDHTVEMADVPFDGGLDGYLAKKKPELGGGASPLDLKLPTAGQAQTVESLGLQLNLNKVDKSNKGMSNARQKNKIAKLGVPSLDLSGLKNVKEYKDWYGYSQKLENCIRLLREKVDALEKEKDMQHLQLLKQETQIENLNLKNRNHEQQHKLLNEKYQDLLANNFKS